MSKTHASKINHHKKPLNTKPLTKSAIAKIAQRPNGFRVNVHDLKQKTLLDMALELVRDNVISQTTRLGSVAVYHAVITHQNMHASMLENTHSVRGQ